jgi:arsenite methyltransferase
MDNPNNSSPADESLYFTIQADFGFTKHPGGFKATRELVNACHIDRESYVLEIGCGVGRTPCTIVEETGCRMMGIDLSEGMVEKARERAKTKGLEDHLEFRVADAQDLPFEDGTFDAVISESVNAFVPDKAKAMREYARVTKPGGYVGLNEVHWVQEPSPELVQYARLIMAGAQFLTVEGWKSLLVDAGLQEIEVHSFKLDMRQQRIDEMRSIEKGEGTKAWGRFLKGLFTNPAYWKFTKQVLRKPGMMFQFMKFIGYGIYVGKSCSH